MDVAEPAVEKDERKPKKRTIKQFKEEKERERQSVNSLRPQFLGRATALLFFLDRETKIP
jgi:hypothetical protein